MPKGLVRYQKRGGHPRCMCFSALEMHLLFMFQGKPACDCGGLGAASVGPAVQWASVDTIPKSDGFAGPFSNA